MMIYQKILPKLIQNINISFSKKNQITSIAASPVTAKTFPLRNTNIPTARTKIIKPKKC